jgi:RPA family protein
MSESEDGDDGGSPGNREVAYRIFAAEFDDAELEFSESDEERAPNYVVMPTGARVNRMFAVGVLTEIEQVNEDVLRARVVDPTGAFVVYAGQYQPDEMAALERMDPPAFVAVTGKANTFQPDDSDVVYTSIRPESINRVDADTRDRWAVRTAEQTLERIGTMADALAMDERGDELEAALRDRGVDRALAQGIPLAVDYDGTTREYLGDLWDVAIDASRVVADEIDADEVGPLTLGPGDGGDEAGVEFTVSQVSEPAGTTPTAETPGESEPAADDPGVDEETAADAEAIRDTETTVEDSEDAEEALGDWDDTADVEPGQETVTDEEFEPEEDAVEDLGTGDVGDEMYELDEEEREQIEEEYGTEFSTGTEVGEPGEADIDVGSEAQRASEESSGGTPRDSEPGDAVDGPTETEPSEDELTEGQDDVEATAEADAEQADALEATSDELPDDDLAEAAEEAGERADSGDAAADAETADEDEAAEAATDAAPDEDLDSAVMDAMEDLDDGDGAPREELVAAVVDRTGAAPDEVEDAIQDALMGGQCYEAGEDTLKPI